MMKFICTLFYCFGCWFSAIAQDTFSIVAIDTVSGEIGSAGASCLDNGDIAGGAIVISDIQPGIGAIHSQARLNFTNKNNARTRMLAGDSPQQIIDWLIANDVDGTPEVRQYGIVDTSGSVSVRAAAFTGADAMDFKGHIVGPNYAIQGNILLGQAILDSMEAGFVNTQGTLADKLMAAMQGANVPGADTRCLSEGVSSQSAFLRVAKPYDIGGNFYLDLNVGETPFGEEPIDSLQTLFDNFVPRSCEYVIPSDAIVANGDTSVTGNDLIFWVCEGDSLELTGARNLVYLETGAYCEIIGGASSTQNTVYLKSTSEAKAPGTLQNAGFYEPGAIIGDLGIARSLTVCDSVVYDYSEAPAAGCFGTTSREEALQTAWQFLPISENEWTVQWEGIRIQTVQLRDLSGKLIREWSPTGQQIRFSTNGMARGLYLLQVQNQNGASSSRKFIVQ
ncbi:MAG: DUF1028 domain-containing protein [Bacteroidota bacterium]